HVVFVCFFFSSRRRHTRWPRDWSSDVCSSDLKLVRDGCFVCRTFSKGEKVVQARAGRDTWRKQNNHRVRACRSAQAQRPDGGVRSEERRVGKGWRGRWRTAE